MKFGMIGMPLFLRKHTYFHGSDILLDLKVICYALDLHNWVDFQRSFANKNCLSGPFNAELCSKRYWWGPRSQEVKGAGRPHEVRIRSSSTLPPKPFVCRCCYQQAKQAHNKFSYAVIFSVLFLVASVSRVGL